MGINIDMRYASIRWMIKMWVKWALWVAPAYLNRVEEREGKVVPRVTIWVQCRGLAEIKQIIISGGKYLCDELPAEMLFSQVKYTICFFRQYLTGERTDL